MKKQYWALYNASTLWTVERTQQECKKIAIQAAGEEWAKCKKYFDIIKVTVKPVDK